MDTSIGAMGDQLKNLAEVVKRFSTALDPFNERASTNLSRLAEDLARSADTAGAINATNVVLRDSLSTLDTIVASLTIDLNTVSRVMESLARRFPLLDTAIDAATVARERENLVRREENLKQQMAETIKQREEVVKMAEENRTFKDELLRPRETEQRRVAEESKRQLEKDLERSIKLARDETDLAERRRAFDQQKAAFEEDVCNPIRVRHRRSRGREARRHCCESQRRCPEGYAGR